MISNEQRAHEEGFFRSFVLPQRRNRYLEILAKPKRRQELLSGFAHFKHPDPRSLLAIPSARQRASAILEILKSKGSGETCWVMSEWAELDGQQIRLQEALVKVIGNGMGTFISCIAGALGYFEDEERRFILENRRLKTSAVR